MRLMPLKEKLSRKQVFTTLEYVKKLPYQIFAEFLCSPQGCKQGCYDKCCLF